MLPLICRWGLASEVALEASWGVIVTLDIYRSGRVATVLRAEGSGTHRQTGLSLSRPSLYGVPQSANTCAG